MANYYANCRSNYFKVKDLDAFKAWASDLKLEVVDGEKGTAILGNDPDGGGWPRTRYIENPKEGEEEWIDLDLATELQEHLQEGQVAILMESGAEKLRYIIGHAIAITPGKPVLHLALDGIYKIAYEQFEVEPNSITRCEY